MKILVLGAGSIGKRHIKNLISLEAEVFVVEPKNERREEVVEFGINSSNIFKTREDAINLTKYNGAIIATPTSMHYEDAFFLVKHGINLMIEKPLGMDSGHAEELEKNASEKGVFLFTAYCFRFDPIANQFVQFLQRKTIGDLLYARAEMSTYLPDWHPHEDYRNFYMSKKELGGGTLLDQSHLYDMALWFFGDIASVFGVTKKHSNLEIETDDFGEFLFHMKSGIDVSIHIDLFTRPWREFFQVSGTNGTIFWDIHTRKIFLEEIDGKKTILAEGKDYNQMYVNELSYFIEQLKSGDSKDGPHFHDGKRVVEIIDAIRTSSEQKRVVSL